MACTHAPHLSRPRKPCIPACTLLKHLKRDDGLLQIVREIVRGTFSTCAAVCALSRCEWCRQDNSVANRHGEIVCRYRCVVVLFGCLFTLTLPSPSSSPMPQPSPSSAHCNSKRLDKDCMHVLASLVALMLLQTHSQAQSQLIISPSVSAKLSPSPPLALQGRWLKPRRTCALRILHRCGSQAIPQFLYCTSKRHRDCMKECE